MVLTYFAAVKLARPALTTARKWQAFLAGLALMVVIVASYGVLFLMLATIYFLTPSFRTSLRTTARQLNGWGAIWLVASAMVRVASGLHQNPTSGLERARLNLSRRDVPAQVAVDEPAPPVRARVVAFPLGHKAYVGEANLGPIVDAG